MTGTAPIAVALDARDLETASAWARAVEPHVSTLKIGLELFCRYGPEAIASVRGGSRIDLFLDLKLNDIPNTVAGAVRSVARVRPAYLTVHALGGRAMIQALGGDQVRVEQRDIPRQWPSGRFDLIVLSEVLYYFGDHDLEQVLKQAAGSLEPDRTHVWDIEGLLRREATSKRYTIRPRAS